MDRARDELLARAALAHDQHGHVRPRDLAQDPEQALHRRGAADDALETGALVDLAPQLDVVAAQARVLDAAREARAQLGDVDGLREVVGRAVAEGLDRVALGAAPRDQDHDRVGLLRTRALQHLEAREVGHHEVGQHRVEELLRQARDALLPGVRQRAAVAVELQAVLERLGVRLVVVDDQHPVGLGLRAHRCSSARFSAPVPWISTSSGSTIEKLVPRPFSETTVIVPSCSSTMRRVVERPRPVPPFLVE